MVSKAMVVESWERGKEGRVVWKVCVVSALHGVSAAGRVETEYVDPVCEWEIEGDSNAVHCHVSIP